MRKLLIVLAGLIAAAVFLRLGYHTQQELRRDRPLLPLTFAHADHVSVNCVLCHHNFIDRTGAGLCLDCHKTDPAVNALIETQFHDLCRDCHVEKQAQGKAAGPTRACDACHTADDAP